MIYGNTLGVIFSVLAEPIKKIKRYNESFSSLQMAMDFKQSREA